MNGAWGVMGAEMNSLPERTEVEKIQIALGQREEEHSFSYSPVPYKYIVILKANALGIQNFWYGLGFVGSIPAIHRN